MEGIRLGNLDQALLRVALSDLEPFDAQETETPASSLLGLQCEVS